MKPKVTRTVRVNVDEKPSPDSLQRALDLLWTQDVPGDAELSTYLGVKQIRMTASWDVLDLPPEPDETEAEDADRIPLEDARIIKSTEDSVTIMASVPERFQPAFRFGEPVAMSVGPVDAGDLEDAQELASIIDRRIRDALPIFKGPDPEAVARAVEKNHRTLGYLQGL